MSWIVFVIGELCWSAHLVVALKDYARPFERPIRSQTQCIDISSDQYAHLQIGPSCLQGSSRPSFDHNTGGHQEFEAQIGPNHSEPKSLPAKKSKVKLSPKQFDAPNDHGEWQFLRDRHDQHKCPEGRVSNQF